MKTKQKWFNFSFKNMVFITEDTWRKNGVELTIVDDMKWLNEKHIKNN